MSQESESRLGLRSVISAAVLLWLVLGISMWFVARGINAVWQWKDVTEVAGSLGDSFGGVNALFSGVALACVAYAIFLQRQDLVNQARQIKMQRSDAAPAINTSNSSAVWQRR